MIGIFDNDGKRLPITINGLVLNSPDDDHDNTYEVNSIAVSTAVDTLTEARQFRDGLEMYGSRKLNFLIRIDGMIRAKTMGNLYDKISSMAKYLDPGTITYPTATSLVNVLFSTPTDDYLNYPSGLISCKYLARPRTIPTPTVSQFTGTVSPFTIELVVSDPRRYLSTATTKAATGSIDNSLATYRSWPTLTLNMGGAGSATYSISLTSSLGTKTLTLNLSARSNGQVVTVDFANKKVSVGTTETPSIYVSGEFWEMMPESGLTLGAANTSNVSSFSLSWSRAFSL